MTDTPAPTYYTAKRGDGPPPYTPGKQWLVCGGVGDETTWKLVDVFTAPPQAVKVTIDGTGTVNATLAERGSRYGPFPSHAAITQGLKDNLRSYPGWHSLTNDQREAIDMICHKLGRIINGDPNYDDSWLDIAGYAQLIVNRLRKDGPQ